MGTDDFLKIVDGLIKNEYKFLETLDASNNRISGVEGGLAIGKLITRPVVDLDYGHTL
jgi:hypothetical protein